MSERAEPGSGTLARAPSRIRSRLLAWLLGLSIAFMAVSVFVEIAAFRRAVRELADRVALLDHAAAARGAIRRVVAQATALRSPEGDEATSVALRAALVESTAALRVAHDQSIAGIVGDGRRMPLPPDVAAKFFDEPRALDRGVRSFLATATDLATVTAGSSQPWRVLASLAGLSSARDLVDDYDAVVAIYIAGLRDRTRALDSPRYAASLAGHVALVAWISLLYQRMVRRLREDNARHRQVRRELERHARERDAALRDLERGRDEVRDRSLAMLSILEDLRAERGRLDREVGERARAEERFRVVVESAPVGQMLVSKTGTIRLVNAVAERTFGYPRAELVGQRVEILVPERMRDGHPHQREAFWNAPIARPMGAGRHLFARRKDGREVPVEIGLNPVVTDEGSAVLTSVVDISERLGAERALAHANRELMRKNEELEQFVYTVSHDLKSPMVTISGFAGHLVSIAGEVGHAGLVDAAGRVERAARRLRQSLDDLLDLSRAGRTVDDLVRIDLHQLLREAVTEHAGALARSGLQVEIAPMLPAIDADPGRLREVFDNLLTNAVRYASGDGAAAIRIGGERVAGEARLYFEDEGPGVPAEFHERVFGLFVRLSAVGDGSGVGLAIVKRILEAHRGRVWIESPPAGRERGTRVWLAFPDPLLSTWERRQGVAQATSG